MRKKTDNIITTHILYTTELLHEAQTLAEDLKNNVVEGKGMIPKLVDLSQRNLSTKFTQIVQKEEVTLVLLPEEHEKELEIRLTRDLELESKSYSKSNVHFFSKAPDYVWKEFSKLLKGKANEVKNYNKDTGLYHEVNKVIKASETKLESHKGLTSITQKKTLIVTVISLIITTTIGVIGVLPILEEKFDWGTPDITPHVYVENDYLVFSLGNKLKDEVIDRVTWRFRPSDSDVKSNDILNNNRVARISRNQFKEGVTSVYIKYQVTASYNDKIIASSGQKFEVWEKHELPHLTHKSNFNVKVSGASFNKTSKGIAYHDPGSRLEFRLVDSVNYILQEWVIGSDTIRKTNFQYTLDYEKELLVTVSAKPENSGNLSTVSITIKPKPTKQSDAPAKEPQLGGEVVKQFESDLTKRLNDLSEEELESLFNSFIKATSHRDVVLSEQAILEVCNNGNIVVEGFGTLNKLLMRLKMEQLYSGVSKVKFERTGTVQITRITDIVFTKK